MMVVFGREMTTAQLAVLIVTWRAGGMTDAEIRSRLAMQMIRPDVIRDALKAADERGTVIAR